MAKRTPTNKFGSVKATPLFQGIPGLEFDNMDKDDVTALTDEQRATVFLSKYLELEHPLTQFKIYFQNSVKGEAWEFKELKRFFIQLVVSGKWTEEKFITVVNSIYRDNQTMTAPTLDARGKFFDQGRLVAPDAKPINPRRRGRI